MFCVINDYQDGLQQQAKTIGYRDFSWEIAIMFCMINDYQGGLQQRAKTNDSRNIS